MTPIACVGNQIQSTGLQKSRGVLKRMIEIGCIACGRTINEPLIRGGPCRLVVDQRHEGCTSRFITNRECGNGWGVGDNAQALGSGASMLRSSCYGKGMRGVVSNGCDEIVSHLLACGRVAIAKVP